MSLCPKCGSSSATHVIDTRPTDMGIRRRRACRACGARFSTLEINDEALRSLAKARRHAATIGKHAAQLSEFIVAAVDGRAVGLDKS